MSPSTWSVQTQWPPDARHVRDARRFVTDRLVADELDDLVDVVTIIVSELVTNAVRHAGSPFRITVERQDGGLLLEVHDESSSPARIPDPTFLADGGRGLALVGSLSETWGVTAHPGGGKSVWARVRLDDDSQGR